jgi:hypothetical protein
MSGKKKKILIFGIIGAVIVLGTIGLVLGLVLTKKSKNDPINDEYVTVTYSTVLVRN